MRWRHADMRWRTRNAKQTTARDKAARPGTRHKTSSSTQRQRTRPNTGPTQPNIRLLYSDNAIYGIQFQLR
jgi:hypothetical protein